MIRIELISHAYSGPNSQYAKLLNYQLSSLVLNPPQRAYVTMTVVWAQEPPWYSDSGVEAVLAGFINERHFTLPQTVTIKSLALPRGKMFMRPIGRNQAAKASEADIVWFTDCDYVFGPECLDTLAGLDLSRHPLFFPKRTLICRDHARGDAYIDAVREPDRLHDIDPADFQVKRETVAIGGIQIVPGDVARAVGYCGHIRKYMRPVDPAHGTVTGFLADKAYRRSLKSDGAPLHLPNVFRIRHSATGDDRAVKAGIPQRKVK